MRGDRITSIARRGALTTAPANERIDAGGLVLAPGFIDNQSHSWSALLIADGRVIGKVSQGVTSEIPGEAATPGLAYTDSIYMGVTAEDSATVQAMRGPGTEPGVR